MMKNIFDIYESILDDMDDVLTQGDEALEASYNRPSARDFKKSPRNAKHYVLAWECSRILEKYKHMYPDMVLPRYNAFHFVIDKEYENQTIVWWYFADSGDLTARRTHVEGYVDSLVGASLATYKKMIIKAVNDMIDNRKSLDDAMAYAYECFKHYQLGKVDSKGNKIIKNFKSIVRI